MNLVSQEVYLVNEFEIYLGRGKSVNESASIRLEEDRTKKRILELPKLEITKNQVEKFNARWKL